MLLILLVDTILSLLNISILKLLKVIIRIRVVILVLLIEEGNGFIKDASLVAMGGGKACIRAKLLGSVLNLLLIHLENLVDFLFNGFVIG